MTKQGPNAGNPYVSTAQVAEALGVGNSTVKRWVDQGILPCAAALYAIRARVEGPADGPKPMAIGGGPEGDPYLLANLLAEMALTDLGWTVVNLGPNTPMPSFRAALSQTRPRLLWLSA